MEELFWSKKSKNEDKKKASKPRYIINKFLAYLFASRIFTITVLIAFFLLGEWYSSRSIPLYPSVQIVFFLICFQIVHGLTNMVFDKTLDIFSRKALVYVFKYISTTEMLISSAIFLIIGLAVLWFINFTIFVVGLILMLITIIYAAPPIRLKTKPPFDTITNALEFGTLPFILGWLATGGQLTSTLCIYSIIMGLPPITCYYLVSWQDIKTDSEFGINNSCTKLGHDSTIYASVIIWIIAMILSPIFFGLFSLFSIVTIITFPIILAALIVYKKLKTYDDRMNALKFFIVIANSVWPDVVLIVLSIWTVSLIPIISLVFFIIYNHLVQWSIFVGYGKDVYLSLKKTGVKKIQ